MFSDCQLCKQRNRHCNIIHWIVLHKPIDRKNESDFLDCNWCSVEKKYPKNVGWPTEVRIGFGLIRKSKTFGLRFTPLVLTLKHVQPIIQCSTSLFVNGCHGLPGVEGTRRPQSKILEWTPPQISWFLQIFFRKREVDIFKHLQINAPKSEMKSEFGVDGLGGPESVPHNQNNFVIPCELDVLWPGT